MIRPSSGNGRNSAERAPTTTARPAARDRPPGVAPRRLADLGMPLRRHRPEAAAEALEPLRAERDFGQQHQHLPPGSERRRDRREIGLGLARAGDPVEHRDAEPGGAGPFEQTPRGAPLIRRQDRGIVPPVGGRAAPPARPATRLSSTSPAAIRPRTTAGAAAGAPRDFGGGHGAAVAQRFEHAPARRRSACCSRRTVERRRARPA